MADRAFIPCTPKHLPIHRLIEAADHATSIFPPNRPAQVHPLATLASAVPSAALPSGVMPPLMIAAMTTKYWGPQPRTIPVSFLDGGSRTLQRRILSHMNAWSESGCIKFALTQGQGQVRISRGTGGYWSYLGVDILLIPANEQTMNLEGFTMQTPDSEFHRVVRHEAGHTLGFVHEHMRHDVVSRIDRQKAYAYFWKYDGWTPEEVDQQVLTPIEQSALMLKPEEMASDTTSIMCYQLPGEITIDGNPIVGGLDIDKADHAYNARIYPKGRKVA